MSSLFQILLIKPGRLRYAYCDLMMGAVGGKVGIDFEDKIKCLARLISWVTIVLKKKKKNPG